MTTTASAFELYPSERELVVRWVQRACEPGAVAAHCVPCNKLFKLLRICAVRTAMCELEKFLADAVCVEADRNGRQRRRDQQSYLTLEGAIMFCAYVYSRKLFGVRVYTRARACAAYIRDTLDEMRDTLEVVRQVAILDGLRTTAGGGGDRLSTKIVTDAVLEYKKTHGGRARAEDVIRELC